MFFSRNCLLGFCSDKHGNKTHVKKNKVHLLDVSYVSTYIFRSDHFDVLAKGRTGTHRKIKETLLIRELKPALNDNVSSEKLYLY